MLTISGDFWEQERSAISDLKLEARNDRYFNCNSECIPVQNMLTISGDFWKQE